MTSFFQDYCTGCGLCQNESLVRLEYGEDGFPYPQELKPGSARFFSNICPMSKNSVREHTSSKIWGDYKGFYSGYAIDNNIRYVASSGGILTAACIYLLKSKKVSGIIQIKANPNKPTETITVLSRTEEEIIKCSGSRYAVSIPLIQINQMIADGEKYAFVGKPCDIIAIKNYSMNNKKIRDSVVYYLSFFCAGTPSRKANDLMLEVLGCPKDECTAFNYRGNGWPGYVTATGIDGKQYKMDYQTAWMTVLGREIKKSCKLCVDSIGEAADLSCGDFWYLTKDKEPSFDERDGRNCVFAWNDKGEQLLEEMRKANMVVAESADIELMRYVQPNHFFRRSTMLYRIMAFKILLRKTPAYPLKKLLSLSKNSSFKMSIRCFKGTVIRIIKGRI